MNNTKQLVEKINQIFVEGNMEHFMDYLTDDVVWTMYTSASGANVMNGKKEVWEMDSNGMPEHIGFEFGTVIVEGNKASVQGASTGKLKGGGAYKGHFCDVYHFNDDSKIMRIESYVIDNRND